MLLDFHNGEAECIGSLIQASDKLVDKSTVPRINAWQESSFSADFKDYLLKGSI